LKIVERSKVVFLSLGFSDGRDAVESALVPK
jgi:hypothetical protein